MPDSLPQSPERRNAAEALVRDAVDGLLAGRADAWVSMFTDDGVFEFPFAPPGAPTRLEGRAAIADYLRDLTAAVRYDGFGPFRFLHDDAADAFVVEFSSDGVALATDRPFHLQYVGVARLRDGRVAHYRDYWNPLVVLEAMGASDPAARHADAVAP